MDMLCLEEVIKRQEVTLFAQTQATLEEMLVSMEACLQFEQIRYEEMTLFFVSLLPFYVCFLIKRTKVESMQKRLLLSF